MAFELTYRLTFIDTIELEPEKLKRSQSLPALGVPLAAEEIQHREPWMNDKTKMMSGKRAPHLVGERRRKTKKCRCSVQDLRSLEENWEVTIGCIE